MTSAELSRSREITPIRMFETQNDNDENPVRVMYNTQKDSLYCLPCGERDCTHCTRVRLSGLLTHTVKEA